MPLHLTNDDLGRIIRSCEHAVILEHPAASLFSASAGCPMSGAGMIGTILDNRYRITEKVARGGMATVYLATDERLDRKCAVKVMHEHLADDEKFRRRFQSEARAAARVSHPGIVAVFDHGEDNGIAYLSMEYVPGRTLRDVLRRDAPLTVQQSMDVCERILEALTAAHREELVHRDVKPENVLVTPEGRIKVADFGLSRLLTNHQHSTAADAMGTVAYLGPEVLDERGADKRTDVYAVGVMLFELLTGQQPFTGDASVQVAYRQVHEDFPLAESLVTGVPEQVDDLIMWATAKQPDDRPRDAAEFAEALQEVRSELTPGQLAVRPQRRYSADGPTPTRVAPAVPPASPSTPAGDHRKAATPPSRRASQSLQGLPTNDTGLLPSAPLPPPPRDNRAARKPFITPTRAILGLVVFAVIATIIAVGVLLLGGTKTKPVPTVTNQARAQGLESLRVNGFVIQEIEEFNDNVRTGTIIRTEPGAGVDADPNQPIKVYVSKGSEYVKMPAITGLTVTEAKKALERVGLALGDQTTEYNDEVAKDAIISATVESTATVKTGTEVSVVVSQGREVLQIPNVVTSSKEDAQNKLASVGFKVEVTTAYSDVVAAGLVVSQQPADGTGFRGDTVQITVSQGSDLVEIPDVRGMNKEQAWGLLQQKGFVVREKRLVPFPFNQATGTEPAAGTKVRRGSDVILKIF